MTCMNCGKDADWHDFDGAIDCFEELGWDVEKYCTFDDEESGTVYDVGAMRMALHGTRLTRFRQKCKWNYHYYIYDSCEDDRNTTLWN